jgi:hypothetical protein
MRTRVWRGNAPPSRSRSSRWRAPTLSGPSRNLPTGSGPSADSSSDDAMPSASRRASSRRTFAPSSLRSAKASALEEDASSHWTSSIAITRVPCALNPWSAPRTATASARGSTGSPDASSTRSAISSARRCGAVNSGRTSSRTPSNRSPSPACARARSASAGRDERTRKSRARASSTPASQSVDLPMPGSPSSTSAAGPPSRRSMKARMEASSSSRPTISGVMVP